MGELQLVDWICAQSGTASRTVKVGPGDDCAVLAGTGTDDMCVTTDQVVEGTHFRLTGRGDGPRARAYDVGYKAMAVSISDLASMGARPAGAVAAAALRKGQTRKFGRDLYRGLVDAGTRYGCPLVGGNLTETSGPINCAVTAIGTTPRNAAFLRSGARPGDVIAVTGHLGGSILGRHLRPEPRCEEALLLRDSGGVHAMMDVSDGLALDLHRLVGSSNSGARIEATAIPVSPAAKRLARRSGKTPLEHALGDGEDYELLVVLDRHVAKTVMTEWKGPTPLHPIGRIVPEREKATICIEGVVRPLKRTGHVHL